jgi:hypothetical protein
MNERQPIDQVSVSHPLAEQSMPQHQLIYGEMTTE